MTQWGSDPNEEKRDPWAAPGGQAQPPAPSGDSQPWGAPGAQNPPPNEPPAWGTPPPQQPGYGQPPPQQYGQQPGYGQPPPQQYGQPAYGQPYGGGMPPAPNYGQPVAGAPGGIAPMGKRFGAFVIDIIILIVGDLILSLVFNKGIGVPALASLLELVWAFGYFGYFLGIRQQSVGMQALGLKVVDANTGGPIGLGRGLLRYLVQGLTGLLCLVGYFSPLFDGSKRNQGWHDKAASCFVVNA